MLFDLFIPNQAVSIQEIDRLLRFACHRLACGQTPGCMKAWFPFPALGSQLKHILVAMHGCWSYIWLLPWFFHHSQICIYGAPGYDCTAGISILQGGFPELAIWLKGSLILCLTLNDAMACFAFRCSKPSTYTIILESDLCRPLNSHLLEGFQENSLVGFWQFFISS